METNTYERTLGTFLLIAGLLIIGYSVILSVNIFFKAQEPPEIFKPFAIVSRDSSPDLAANIPSKNLNVTNPADLQKMMSENLFSPEMIKSIIPPEMFSYSVRIMNLTVFSIFLWVLIAAGGKISSLGIALIKTNSSVKA